MSGPGAIPAVGRARWLAPTVVTALVLAAAAGWALGAGERSDRETRTEALAREVEVLRTDATALRREVAELRFALQVSAASGAQAAPAARSVTGSEEAPGPAGTPVAPREAEAARPDGSVAPSRPAAVAQAVAPGGAEAPSGPPRHYLHLESPTPAVTVRQGSTGALVVTNTDPALAGQRIEILGYTEAPEPVRLEITVPPARTP